MNFYITGDTHGKNADRVRLIPELDSALIILGDAGFNFWLNKTDYYGKAGFSKYNIPVFVVRGNHEERPENLNYPIVYSDIVKGEVYQEPEFPLINYFIDGNVYDINGFSTLVLGGAYSVDKFHRIKTFTQADGWCGWFADEQLSQEERNAISAKVVAQHYDIVLSHTCPLSWQPRELFSNFPDRHNPDNSMEIWLDKLKDTMSFDYWFFGHYHDNMVIRPRVEMLYEDILRLPDALYEWELYDKKEPNKILFKKKAKSFFFE